MVILSLFLAVHFCFLPDSFAWFKFMSKGQEEQDSTGGKRRMKGGEEETTEKKDTCNYGL